MSKRLSRIFIHNVREEGGDGKKTEVGGWGGGGRGKNARLTQGGSMRKWREMSPPTKTKRTLEICPREDLRMDPASPVR